MNRFVFFVSLTAIVSLSCNLVSGQSREPALVEATGPILGMTVAASLDDQGRPVDASFTYPAEQPEMVVLVWIGEVAPGPLTFNWYRVIETGDEALFEQTVPVEAWDGAFSTGVNPGILAAGTYKVVATFAGQSETIAWDVAQAQPGDSTAPVGTSGSTSGAAPAPGPSGTMLDVVPETGANDDSGPFVHPVIYSYGQTRQVKFLVLSGWIDERFGIPDAAPESFTVEINATITGLAPGVTMEYVHAAGIRNQHKVYKLDPCSLPGGSDIPGTSITVTAVPLGYEEFRLTDTKILGRDTSRPVIVIDPSIEPGNKVNPGDQIVWKVAAEELKIGGSWQTGIFQMQVTGPGGLVDELWENPSPFPKACGAKTWWHVETFTYTVPPDPPATIELCASAADYSGYFNEPSCGTYYTGDQLTGRLTSTLTTSLLGGQNIGTDVAQGEADLSLTLLADGTLIGAGVYTYAQDGEGTHSCGPYSESSGPMQLTLPVNGTWTKDEIVFRFTTDAPIMIETKTTCAGETQTAEHDVTNMFVGTDWIANWDGQSYSADVKSSISGVNWTSEQHWTIHLEPPVP